MPTGFDEIHIEDKPTGKIVLLTFKEEINKEDCQRIIPQLEWLIQKNHKIRILVELRDFKEWTAGALWEGVNFETKHFNGVERMAIVGDARWKTGVAMFIKPFTSADVRYFDAHEMEKAKQWISA